jgi:hypothetical protein
MKQVTAGVMALALATAAPALAQQRDAQVQQRRAAEAQQIRARQNVSMMESVLERAVQSGAQNLLVQLQSVMPDAAMLTGAPQVRGFRVPDYGLFFDVEVPALSLSIAWTLQSMQRGNALAATALSELRAAADRASPADRAQILNQVRRIELALGVLPGQAPARAAAPQALAPGRVAAATTVQPNSLQPLAPPAPAPVVDDPDEAWTREVKSALLDAMLNYSGPLALGNDEWLMVAAKDNLPSDPLLPGDRIALSTIVFRVKGSDLAAFHAKRITLDEARKRVEVTEQ